MKGGRKGQGIVCYETFPNPLGIRISPIKLPLTLSTKVCVVLFFLMVCGSKKERKIRSEKLRKLRCFVAFCKVLQFTRKSALQLPKRKRGRSPISGNAQI